MNYSIFRFTLNMHNHRSQASASVFLGDTAIKLCISLTDGGLPYYIEDGCVAVLNGTKPDGNKLHNRCVIENNSTIVYEFTEQTATCTGITNCDITLYGANGGIVTAPKFIIVVDEREVSDEIVSATEKSALDDVLTRAADIYDVAGQMKPYMQLLPKFSQEYDFNASVYEAEKSGCLVLSMPNSSSAEVLISQSMYGEARLSHFRAYCTFIGHDHEYYVDASSPNGEMLPIAVSGEGGDRCEWYIPISFLSGYGEAIVCVKGIVSKLSDITLTFTEETPDRSIFPSAVPRAIADENGNNISQTYVKNTSFQNELQDVKTYTDTQVENAITNLVNAAPEELDTLKELADAIKDNESVMEALDEAITKKANKSDLDALAYEYDFVGYIGTDLDDPSAPEPYSSGYVVLSMPYDSKVYVEVLDDVYYDVSRFKLYCDSGEHRHSLLVDGYNSRMIPIAFNTGTYGGRCDWYIPASFSSVFASVGVRVKGILTKANDISIAFSKTLPEDDMYFEYISPTPVPRAIADGSGNNISQTYVKKDVYFALEERVADLENLTLTYTEETLTAYERSVPAEVGKYALIKSIGGATIVSENELITADVERIESIGADGTTIIDTFTIPQAVRDIEKYGIDSTYNDRIEWVDDKVSFTKQCKKIVLNGTEAWNENLGNSSGAKYFYLIYDTPLVANICICDQYNRQALSISNNLVGVNVAGVACYKYCIIVRPENANAMSVDDFKLDLAENPITIVCALANPTVTDITKKFNVDNAIQVEGGGTLRFVNTSEQAVPSTIQYLTRKG